MGAAVIKLTQGKQTLVDQEDLEWLSQWKWHFKEGYAVRTDNRLGRAIPLHREILKTPKGLQTDHINRDKLDNRRENLRIATSRENNFNKRLLPSNKSGYKGVYFAKDHNKWRVVVTVDNKKKHIGYFSDPKLAAKAYDLMVVKIQGEFALTNKVMKGGY